MGKYSSDSAETIVNQFSLEGDALDRAGFAEPDLSAVPEEKPATEIKPVTGPRVVRSLVIPTSALLAHIEHLRANGRLYER